MDIYLLDMGSQKYGDSIVIIDGTRRILIDGGHMNDNKPKDGHTSLQDQIGEVLGQDAPYEFDLLVVTHCHSDHIGCLPLLVGDGTITAKWALLADPDLGYPAGAAAGGGDAVVDKVVVALREEPVGDMKSDAELDAFLSDALNLEGRYRAMCKQLQDSGTTRTILFTGLDDPGIAGDLADLKAAFKAMDLTILGPTAAHLQICSDALAGFQAAAKRASARRKTDDAGADAVSLYRLLTGAVAASDGMPDDILQFIDKPGSGAALNDQSIVLTVGKGKNVCLFTADMQFALAEIGGLDGEMAPLLQKTADAGPYAFVKLPHHGSYNGLNQTVLDDWAKTQMFGVSGGTGDPGHPDPSVLSLLKTVKGQSHWVRTDKNGRIGLTVTGGKVDADRSRGRLDDGSPNSDDTVLAGPAPIEERTVSKSIAVAASADGVVEVSARIPHVSTKVTITVDVQPGASVAPVAGNDRPTPRPGPRPTPIPAPAPDKPLASGRKLPKLLFVTNSAQLARNIGRSEAAAALAMIKAAGQPLLDVRSPGTPFPEVAAELTAEQPVGVVLVGGYDVLPPVRYSVIPANLRQQLGAPTDDPDDFIVWSDQRYGDKDSDELGELPVSRIPDGKSAELVLNALAADSPKGAAPWFGLRNFARPFAQQVFTAAGGQGMLVSEPIDDRHLQPQQIDAQGVYFMLHGSDVDATRYVGERQAGGYVDAVRVGNVPVPNGAVVFAGCCWGALAGESALRHQPNTSYQSLTPGQSIALSFLLHGANSYVGCTGAHYSPVSNNPADPLNYFGAPMHTAFWSHLAGGAAPAQALFDAKMDYIGDMFHGRTAPEEQAIEYKILREFTCLGLGW